MSHHGHYIIVMLRPGVRLAEADGRVLGHYSAYGNHHAVSKPTALRMVDAGVAKLPRHMSLNILRAEVEALAA